ncbi:epoxide hydrolase [Xylariomycetidae sp. FL0641]|nr:epoxide hydrolase [Xylariomycetidae sp. FL0641]
MDGFEKKTVDTPRGYTYTYYISAPRPGHPPLLMQHGFPDEALMWQGVASQLVKDHQVIIPDMLGYGGSSKPTSPSAYDMAGQAGDLAALLDHEQVPRVVSVGHDWGTAVAGGLWLHHPSRVAGLVLLSGMYGGPAQAPFDLAAACAAAEQAFGYPANDYHYFLTAPDAPALIERDLDRFYLVQHGAPRDWMRRLLCTPGALRAFVADADDGTNKEPDPPLRKYAQAPGMRERFVRRIARDGIAAPLAVYRSLRENVQYESLRHVPADRFKVAVPVLLVFGDQDAVCRPEVMAPAKAQGLLPDCEEHVLDSGHWVTYEKPQEVAALMEGFLRRKISA